MPTAMTPAGCFRDAAASASRYGRQTKEALKKLFYHSVILLTLALLSRTTVLTQAACTTTINGDQPTVQTAVNAASDGDVICLNAGSWIYTTHVEITDSGTVGVEIRGAGSFQSPWGADPSTQTIITNHSTGNGVFFGYEPNGTHNPTISNITFLIDSSTQAGQYVFGTSMAAGQHKEWIVHHNTFTFNTTPGCNAKAGFIGTGHAVIYRNIFTTTFCTGGFTNVNVLDVAFGGNATTSWESASTFGSADSGGTGNVYLETNYIEGFLITDISTSARFVGRFNEIHLGTFGGHGYDSNVTGIRGAEYYYNTFSCNDIYSGSRVPLTNWISQRGGTGFVHNNTFPAPASPCNITTAQPAAYHSASFKTLQCIGIPGWPGSYPDTYPVSHQPGWGWISGSNQNVGTTAKQNWPGGASGFAQALEPIYLANNTNNTGVNPVTVQGNGGECRAMAYSNKSKASGTTLVIPAATTASTSIPYANVGQELVAVLGDLVGGTTPTIASSPTCTWNPLTAGTNGSMRLSAWNCTVVTGGAVTVTFTHDSSAAARSGTVAVLRGMTASPLDANPAVVTDNTSPYDAPLSGTLSQAVEIVLGYFALNGPTVNASNGGAVLLTTDTIAAGASDTISVSNGSTGGAVGVGFNATTGGAATDNVTAGITYRVVNATTSIAPRITNTTANRDGLAGTVSFKVTGTASSLDLLDADVIAFNREIYNDIPASGASFDGTVGTGSGARASRPATCTTGVAYWSTDQGSWNTSGSGGNGVLDKCTGTNTWTNAWYVPYDYPHPLATVNGASPPTPGNSGILTTSAVTSTTLTVSWTAASAATGTPLYYLCRSASPITTVAECLAATQLQDYTAAFTTYNDTGRTPLTTYYYNYVLTDDTGLTVLGNDVSQLMPCGATKVVFTAQPSSAVIGATLGTVTAVIQNASSTTCTDSSASIVLSTNASTTWGVLTSSTGIPGLTKAATAGVATWTDLFASSTIGTGPIDANSTGLTKATSDSIAITDAPIPPAGGGAGVRLRVRTR